MDNQPLDTHEFWENRLASDLSLKGTGHRAFDLEYNRWLYRAQHDCMDLLLARHSLTLDKSSVLDIGSGNGFYIQYFLEKGAGMVSGVDISETSVDYLRRTYPQCRFTQADISRPELPYTDTFDYVTAISVLFHIVDDTAFSRAIGNLSRMLKPGGCLIVSDSFARPIVPTAKHVRLRELADYRREFERVGLKIIQLLPMFYLLNQTFIPFAGPRMINFLRLGRFFYRLDASLRARGWGNLDGAKLLLAQRVEG